jgi:FKBP-type peptidyl-prolyl cis-trans isomerase
VTKRSHLTALLASAAAIAVAGCGSSGSTTTAEIPAGPAPAAPAAPPTPKASTNLKDTKSKPIVPKQTGAPPKKLVVKDIVVGKGKAAKKGDKLSMQYVGVLFKGGEQFDASWDNGSPFDFQLGKDPVIKGWEQGLVGIKPGGRRELIIPAKLAYGATGQPPTIPPNAALVFIVDALSVGK